MQLKWSKQFSFAYISIGHTAFAVLISYEMCISLKLWLFMRWCHTPSFFDEFPRVGTFGWEVAPHRFLFGRKSASGLGFWKMAGRLRHIVSFSAENPRVGTFRLRLRHIRAPKEIPCAFSPIKGTPREQKREQKRERARLPIAQLRDRCPLLY